LLVKVAASWGGVAELAHTLAVEVTGTELVLSPDAASVRVAFALDLIRALLDAFLRSNIPSAHRFGLAVTSIAVDVTAVFADIPDGVIPHAKGI
jgi:hypothetical protein